MRMLKSMEYCFARWYSCLFQETGLKAILLLVLTLSAAAGFSYHSGARVSILADESGNCARICMDCDNVINGGQVAGDEFGCPDPDWDPSIITNVVLPSGGTGNLEFIWIYTTDNPNDPYAQWTPIPGSIYDEYDPGPISITTYFRRCARRSGCADYIAESNIVAKEAICCDNVTEGGSITGDQSTCLFPFDPDPVTDDGAPSGGTGITEYQWVMSTTGTPYDPSNPDWAFVPDANTADFDPDSLFQNTFFIRLSRRHGCTDFAGVSNMVSIVLDNPIQVDTLVSTGTTCFNGSDGSISLALSGGAFPINYLWWPNGGNAEDPQNLAPGTYYFTATDFNGCSITDSIEVDDVAPMEVQLLTIAESCFGAGDGSIAVESILNGTAPFNYAWDDPSASTSELLDPVPPGVYTVAISDANNCTAVANDTVQSGVALQVALEAVTPTCLGASDGSASVIEVQGGQAPFNYSWDDAQNQTTSTASLLLAGTYTVTVTDTSSCEGSASIDVAEGTQIATSITAADASCANSVDGTATVIPDGGVEPYTYLWSDQQAQTTSTATGLSPGLYSVTVSDANGCTAVDSVAVSSPPAITLEINAANVSCHNGGDGTAQVIVIAGITGPLLFQWDDPTNSTSNIITGLAAGTYTVTVSDGTGCSATASANITEPDEIELAFDITPASCPTSTDGGLFVNATGGTPFTGGAYQYSWDVPNDPGVAALSGISPGTFQVAVTDSLGCSASDTATVYSQSVLSVSFQITPVSCFGAQDGSALAEAEGGVPPYSYSWDVPGSGDQPSVSGLGQGQYNLTITDGNGCTQSASFELAAPAALFVTTSAQHVVCADDTNGAATANTQGGTQPYSFLWSNGQSAQTAVGLAAGIYEITVTDDHGCQSSATAVVNVISDLSLTLLAQPVSCAGSSDGQVSATPIGGAAPFSYNWSTGDTTAASSGLPAGEYFVTVTDANGCATSGATTVGEPDVLGCQASVVAPVTTYGGNEGAATVAASGGTDPYQYDWDNGSTTDTAFQLSAGSHSATVTDAKGCTCVTHISLSNPSKVGNFVWNDVNQNGLQDPGEPGIVDVTVQLTGNTFGNAPVSLTTQTDSAGGYAFDGLAAGFYYLEFELVSNAVFTAQDAGNDLLDSDVDPATGSTPGFALNAGYFNQTLDCGIILLDETVDVGDWVWLDSNRDGIQDSGEGGISGVTVRLYTWPANTLEGTRVTDAGGHYIFEDLPAGDYYIGFMLNSLPNGYLVSPKDAGADDLKDSDVDPVTEKTDVFTVQAYTLDMLGLDMGAYKECDNVSEGGEIGFDEELCGLGSDPAEIVNLELPTGGFGDLEYLWLYSYIPIFNGPGDPNWTPIPNSNSPNYDPGPSGQSIFYIRCSRRQGCSEYPVETNVVSKVVTPYPITQIIDEPGALCEGEGGRFEAAIAGGGATYAWDFSGDATPASATTRVVNPVSWAAQGVKTATLTVTRFGCSASASTSVIVNNCFQPLIVIDDMTATPGDNVIELNWRVSSNVDDLLFFVQRSDDGEDFDNLGVLSMQHAQPGGWFSFTNQHPRPGKNYYRIRYTALSDNTLLGYSPLAEAWYQPPGSGIAGVYPNPTMGEVALRLLKPGSGEAVQIQITTPYGQVLQQLTIAAGDDKLQLDLSDLPAGVYLITVKQKGFRELTQKVVKLK